MLSGPAVPKADKSGVFGNKNNSVDGKCTMKGMNKRMRKFSVKAKVTNIHTCKHNQSPISTLYTCKVNLRRGISKTLPLRVPPNAHSCAATSQKRRAGPSPNPHSQGHRICSKISHPCYRNGHGRLESADRWRRPASRIG
ncbi:hypothetical protein IG631_18517 [Alternaria alternata]|nr:hypothetical protein IG631_18517 [Alternaria alternata]